MVAGVGSAAEKTYLCKRCEHIYLSTISKERQNDEEVKCNAKASMGKYTVMPDNEISSLTRSSKHRRLKE